MSAATMKAIVRVVIFYFNAIASAGVGYTSGLCSDKVQKEWWGTAGGPPCIVCFCLLVA